MKNVFFSVEKTKNLNQETFQEKSEKLQDLQKKNYKKRKKRKKVEKS
jgi:hypothetical protein